MSSAPSAIGGQRSAPRPSSGASTESTATTGASDGTVSAPGRCAAPTEPIHTWVGSATDIHDEKRFEASLHKSEREAIEMLSLLDSVDAAAPVGFKLVDQHFRIVRINDRLARTNGMPADEHIGRTRVRGRPAVVAAARARLPQSLGGRVLRQHRPDRDQRRGSGTAAALACQLLPGARRRRGRRRGQRRVRRHGPVRGRRVPRRRHGQHGRRTHRARCRGRADLHESGGVPDARVGDGRTARNRGPQRHPLPTSGR